MTRWIGRRDAEWILLSLWVALLGVQVPVDIPNFRFSPADIVLAALVMVLAVRRPRELLRAATARTPVHVALVLLLFALAWGSVISFTRTGTVAREALFNKDIGFFVLAAIVAAVRALVYEERDIRALLRTLLVTGSVVSWLAALTTLLLPLLTANDPALRFEGYLLNPSANAVFLGVLLMVQIGSERGMRIVTWSRRLQVANGIGLTLLLLLTLSRSSWLAVMLAILVLTVFTSRDRLLLPAVVATVLLIFAAPPLALSLVPLVTQVTAGKVGTFERETAPFATPAPDVGAILAKSSALPTATASPPSVPTASGSVAMLPTPAAEPSQAGVAERFITGAGVAATDRFGATDRVALDLLAVRLWLADPLTAATGIGLEVFLQVSAAFIGTPVIIHNTYVWLPVEMGLPGIAALLTVVYAMWWTARGVVKRGVDDSIVVIVVGGLVLFAIWIAINEGLYQRTIWMMLALGGAAIARTHAASVRAEG